MTASRIQPPFGLMQWDDGLGWWQSELLSVPLFGDQRTRISIPSEPHDTADAPIAPDIVNAGTAFLSLPPRALAPIEPHVWAYYKDMKAVWEDCPKISRDELWLNVQLNGVSIERREEDQAPCVSIECNCEWEPEHGMQLVLQSGVRWIRASDFSGHLTEGEAYACPALDEWMVDPDATLPLRSRLDVLAIVNRGR